MDEDSVRRREELARAALLYAGTELLDYSEEEEAEGENGRRRRRRRTWPKQPVWRKQRE